MDKETVQYIVNYFSHLLTGQEQLAVKHTISTLKLGNNNSGNKIELTRIYKRNGWITENQSVLDLLKDGYDSFESRVAERILANHPNEVFLNKCSNCGKLARTPYAKQCRYCGNDWH